MGTWGTALYSSDVASDVRDICKEVFAFYDVEKGNDIIFAEFNDIVEQDYIDNEYASFWYALADWQWKHGMLNDAVKYKALQLLERYAGTEEWIEDGDLKGAEKRKNILNSLKNQLISPQPQYKKPKASIARPKHKPGDIIIFRPSMESSEDGYPSVWEINDLNWPIYFESPALVNTPFENIPCCDARGKYLAILCVGSVKEPHSQYVDNVFDERSLYVWYDYLSEAKPTLRTLKSCGFLPSILLEWQDFNRRITKSANWIYTFALYCESFRVGKNISEVLKLQDATEVERFYHLFSQKKYSSDYRHTFEAFSMFSTAFEEKLRASLINQQIDNLLDVNSTNPKLASPSKIDKERRKRIKQSSEVSF